MGYDFIIEYHVANGLSRKGKEAVICILTLPHPNWWDSIVKLHDANIKIKNMREKVERGELGEKWSVKKGVHFYKD